jgi:hypothetical protein
VTELLSMLTENGLTERYAHKTAQEILTELNEHNRTLIYMFYRETMRLWPDQYGPHCHIIAENIMYSKRVDCWRPVAGYLIDAGQKTSDTYHRTFRNFVSRLQTLLTYGVDVTSEISAVQELKTLVNYLYQVACEDPQLHAVMDETLHLHFLEILQQIRLDIITIETKTKFRERILAQNGIIVYLKYLIQNGGIDIGIDEDYKNLDAQQRKDYVKENMETLRPFFDKRRNHINLAYLDMLEMLLAEDGQMQSRNGMQDRYMQLAMDCKQVAMTIMERGNRIETDILLMLDECIDRLSRTRSYA